MIQRYLHTVLKQGMEKLRDNPELVEAIFAQYELSTTEVDAIKTAMTSLHPKIKHQYARIDDTFPVISIVLAGEDETDEVLGDYAQQEDDGSETLTSFWTHRYDLLIYTENPDHTQYLYEMVKAIIIAQDLTEFGLYQTHYSGGDVAPDPRYAPEHLFLRRFSIKGDREFYSNDPDSALGKAFRVAGIHIDKSGSPSDVGGVKTLVTVPSED